MVIPLHGVGLARAGLSVCEDGGVVALEGLVDKMVDLALVVDVLLRGLFAEDGVEMEVLGSVAVVDLHLLALGVAPDAGILVPVFDFVFEEGPDTDDGFDFAAH